VVAACGIWCFGFQVVGMVWSWGLCVRFAGCCSSPQTGHITCWANNKICNKNHLLHLVGILFPHIDDDAWSKSHQMKLLLHIWQVISFSDCQLLKESAACHNIVSGYSIIKCYVTELYKSKLLLH
jgi:hypothetical protein